MWQRQKGREKTTTTQSLTSEQRIYIWPQQIRVACGATTSRKKARKHSGRSSKAKKKVS